MATETKLNISVEDLVNYSASQNEPQWMTDLRKDSFQKLEQLEMPKPDKTKINRWDFDSFKSHTVESDTFESIDKLPESVQKIIDTENAKNLIVQHNNTPAFTKVDDKLTEQGVVIKDLKTALIENSDLVQKYFMTDAVKVDEHRLTALHAALVNGGVFVYVPKNVVVEDPIQYVVLHDDSDASFFNHAIIVAEESAEVTYVENYL